MTRRDIAFDAEGVTLRGWFYPAEGTSAPGAAVVMAHGFSAVKEMYLDSFAEVFAVGGLNILVFDNRCFGASDGEPRQEIDPWAQIRDYRHAITYAFGRALADPALAAWRGQPGRQQAGQRALARRVAINVAAVAGRYTPDLELDLDGVRG